MLFSNPEIADYINENFEAAWQSLRPVPIVRIDFGGEHIVTRTLHGNIATYVCLPNGHVLDILPGLYEPRTYLQQLDQLSLLKTFVEQSLRRPQAILKDYHQRQALALARNEAPASLQRMSLGQSISGREIGVKVVLSPSRRSTSRGRAAAGKTMLPAGTQADFSQIGADAKLLAEDTRINETVRRRLVHEFLSEHVDMTPADLTRWLYREVLKADLDDPYLGLGELLFGDNEPTSARRP